MKRLLYNQIKRKIMLENDSLYAMRLEMNMAIRKLGKEFIKSPMGRFLDKTVDLMERMLSILNPKSKILNS